METKFIKVNEANYNLTLSTLAIFEWKVTEHKFINGQHLVMAERDNSVPYYDELVKLEKEFGNDKIPSLVLGAIFPIIALVLMAAFSIIYFLTKDQNINFLLIFLPFAIPAFILLGLGVILIYKRLKKAEYIANNRQAKEEEYKKLVAELKK